MVRQDAFEPVLFVGASAWRPEGRGIGTERPPIANPHEARAQLDQVVSVVALFLTRT